MRHEFSTKTKREALKRSGGLCEAVGAVYGLAPGRRCNAPLSHGVEFDHYPVAATEPDSNGLDNCVSVCPTCHKHKTRTFDVPMQAKSKRVSDRHLGIHKTATMQSLGFRKAPAQRKASSPIAAKFEGDILSRQLVNRHTGNQIK